MAPEIRPRHSLPTSGQAAVVPIKVRILGTPSTADLARLTDSTARAVGRQLRGPMNAEDALPQPISMTFTGPLTLENPHGVQAAVRAGIDRALREQRQSVPSAPRKTLWQREVVEQGDILRFGPIPVVPVLSLSRDFPVWVKAGGYLEVETTNPVRAVQWGRYLFGERGYAVLGKRDDPDRLVVRALTNPLHTGDFGGFVPAISHEPGSRYGTPATTTASGATFVADADADTRPLLVSTAEGLRLYRVGGAASPIAWAGENIERWLAAPDSTVALDEEGASAAVGRLTEGPADDLEIAHIVLALDRSLFRTFGLADRRRYLLALMRVAERAIGGVDRDELDSAIVALVASCTGTSELDALLAPLAADGTLIRLFAQFDKPTFRLLVAVGSLVNPAPPTPRELLDLVVYQLEHPLSALDIVEFLGTVYDWLRGTVSGLGDLPLLPFELGSGVTKLVDLYRLLARAAGVAPLPIPGLPPIPTDPDPEAQAQVRALLSAASTVGRTALLGLRHLEGLPGMAAGSVAGELVNRLRLVVVLEILAAFVTGLPEARLAETVAAQARLLEALAGAADLADAGAASRLLSLLPRSYIEDIDLLLRRAPRRSTRLARFVAGSPEARAAGDRLTGALRIARVIERKAGAATELADDVVAGTHRLLDLVSGTPGWSADAVHTMLTGIPDTALPDLLRIAARLTPRHLIDLGPAAFARAARAPGALAFVYDAGGHAFSATARVFGTNPARYEHFLRGVAEARARLGPERYYELLERLDAGDITGFDDADWLSRAAEQAEKSVRTSTPRPVVPAAELGPLGTIGSTQVFRGAVERVLRADPVHPLRFLLDESGNLRTVGGDAAYWLEHPEITEMGHMTSAKSGGEHLALMSKNQNRLISRTVEAPHIGGYISTDTVLEIGGIPVDPDTAVEWVSAGWLDPRDLAAARRVRFPTPPAELIVSPTDLPPVPKEPYR
ncbi:polymorphic toxin type 5 domain-containing protein [Nocardia terpenica]|uniref:Uncharacterized protein n=1 Tax=Nocardia terpenica TaxID=455432 RepID=A0A6G9Z1Z1_9NOCA|nr:polymorphic toxin type 5 domain-containing protein [Nocardia terpenica]QIS19629.1 hypothetical protein F6W96_16385 [Nocardia terpenica]